MAMEIMTEYYNKICEAEFVSISIDESADKSQLEQVSICLRIVLNGLIVSEIFVGFFQQWTLQHRHYFKFVKSLFFRIGLRMTKLWGQCYDGTANVSGRLTGLQARIREEESRALHVHCTAHKWNLVV